MSYTWQRTNADLALHLFRTKGLGIVMTFFTRCMLAGVLHLLLHSVYGAKVFHKWIPRINAEGGYQFKIKDT